MGGILQVDTIQNNNATTLITQTNSTTLTFGVSGQNIVIPSGVTFNTASATVTLPSSIITGQTAETSVAGGDLVLIYDDSATALRKMTRTNFVAGIGGTNTPLILVIRNSNQSFSTSTFTKLELSTEIYDTNNNFDPTTNYRFTPTVAGKYYLSASANILGGSNNITDGRIAIYKNGAILVASYNILFNANQDLRHYEATINTIDEANGSSDYYEVFVFAVCTTPQIYAGDANVTRANNFLAFKLVE
jgi:hypothetical protein